MKNITLNPVIPTGELMKDLEKKGLITLFSTDNAFIPDTKTNFTAGKTLYETAEEYGTHKLISVSVNRTDIASGIGYHPDREDFLVISSYPDANPLYLIICYLSLEELEAKIADETLKAEDFVMLEMKYCDPETSFFTMNPFVVHGEATVLRGGSCPLFYVTEPSNMPLYNINFKSIELTTA